MNQTTVRCLGSVYDKPGTPARVRVDILLVLETMEPLQWVEYLDAKNFLFAPDEDNEKRDDLGEIRDKYLKAIAVGACSYEVLQREHIPQLW